MYRIGFLSAALFVLLRLAIGWHLLFEGLEKYHSDSWSAEGYLRESVGPLAPRFRELAGDSVADRARSPEKKPDRDVELPAALQRDWQAWLDAFLAKNDLPTDSRPKVQSRFDDLKPLS